jgi:hypothetical protein
MADRYDTHHDYMKIVKAKADARQESIAAELKTALAPYVESRTEDVISFGKMSVDDLAALMSTHPKILKSLCAIANVAGRAIKRDLGIKNINTYNPKVTVAEARKIAELVKDHLPSEVSVRAVSLIDRLSFIDKEIRMGKGQWEKSVQAALNEKAPEGVKFCKRRFKVGKDPYEIDCAYPPVSSKPIQIAVDVKRIEAKQDKQKRTDEIKEKANQLRSINPDAEFFAVLYYPFVDEEGERVSVLSRLKSEHINGVLFASASEESVQDAATGILKMVTTLKPDVA